MPASIVADRRDANLSQPESVGQILGRLAYEYGQTKTPRPKAGLVRRKMVRAAGVSLAVIVGMLLVASIGYGLQQPNGRYWLGIGGDYQTYIEAARSWLGGGPFYHPYQLAPYQVVKSEILYPPTILLLLAPFVYLPAILWWAIPIGVTTYMVWTFRPGPWRLAAMFALLLIPWSLDIIFTGNPALWMLMFLAVGLRVKGLAALVLLKPTLAIFAVFGLSRRSFAIVALMAVVSLALFPLTVQYVSVLLNARWPDGNPLYSLMGVPLMLVPLVARIGSTPQPR